MNTILKIIVNSQGGKIARHIIAALAGYFAAHGYTVAGADIGSLLIALGCFAVSITWSMVMKREITDSMKETIIDLVGAITRQSIPALAAWLTAQGYTGDMTSESVLAFVLLNLINSITNKPDKKP